MKRNGCYNRVFNMETVVQDGYVERYINVSNGYFESTEKVMLPNFITKPFRMTTDCKYDKRHEDTGCTGCKHQGEQQ